MKHLRKLAAILLLVGVALGSAGCTIRYLEQPTPAGNPLPPPNQPFLPPVPTR